MADFISLTCPTCGGKLEITPDMDRFACSHCGNEHLVKRSGGAVSLAPVEAGLKKIQTGTDKTAAELAHRRIQEELAEVERHLHHLFGEADQKMLNSYFKPKYFEIKQAGFFQRLFAPLYGLQWIELLKDLSWEEVQKYLPDNLKAANKKSLLDLRSLLGQRYFLSRQLQEQRQILGAYQVSRIAPEPASKLVVTSESVKTDNNQQIQTEASKPKPVAQKPVVPTKLPSQANWFSKLPIWGKAGLVMLVIMFSCVMCLAFAPDVELTHEEQVATAAAAIMTSEAPIE